MRMLQNGNLTVISWLLLWIEYQFNYSMGYLQWTTNLPWQFQAWLQKGGANELAQDS